LQFTFRRSVSTSTTEVTEVTEKIPMFCPGALGVLGGDRQTETGLIFHGSFPVEEDETASQSSGGVQP